MTLRVKFGNPLIRSNSNEKDVSNIRLLTEVYEKIAEKDLSFSATLDVTSLRIRSHGQTKSFRYLKTSNVNWVVDKMYSFADTSLQKARRQKMSQAAEETIKNFTDLVKQGAYIWIDEKEDCVRVKLDAMQGKMDNYRSTCEADEAFADEIKLLVDATATRRAQAEEKERLLDLINKNGIKI